MCAVCTNVTCVMLVVTMDSSVHVSQLAGRNLHRNRSIYQLNSIRLYMESNSPVLLAHVHHNRYSVVASTSLYLRLLENLYRRTDIDGARQVEELMV